MNIWDRTLEEGRRYAEKESLRDEADRARSWPSEAEDEMVPLVARYKGIATLPTSDGRTYKVLTVEDQDGTQWKINRSAAIRRAFAEQGEPKIGDGIYLQFLGQREFTTSSGETRTYNRMIVRVVQAEDDFPEDPDDDIPF